MYVQGIWLLGPLLGRFVAAFTSVFSLKEFLGDTVLHSWEVLAKILSSDETVGIVCDLGMFVHCTWK